MQGSQEPGSPPRGHRGILTESPALGAAVMPSSLVLPARQRLALLRYYRAHSDPAVRHRAHIILMLAEGHPWSLITSVLYCSTRTIAHWKQCFEDGGVQALLGQQRGAPTRWSAEA